MSEQSKHTPGPWTIDDGNIILGDKGLSVAEVYADDLEQQRHNARLIAAAPTMLEALVDLVETLQNVRMQDGGGQIQDEYADMFSEARAAIAKAEGGAT